MFFYIIQTIFLLLIAFALGALVGYLLKRYFGCPAEVEAQTDVSVAASSGATSATLAASEASVSGEASSAPTSDKGADAPVSGLMASTDAKASAPKANSRKKATAAKTTKTTAAKKATAPAKKVAAPKSAKATAAKTTTAKAATAKASGAKKAPAKKPAASKPAAVAATGPDDLKLIKGVGKLNETRLNDEGITTFAQVAAWKKADIADFDEKLNFKGRIEREEWVPQAKVLAKGSAKKKPATASTAPAKKAAAPKTAKASAATASKNPAAKKPVAKKAAPKKAAPKAPAKPDDLKLIKGVGKLIETKLAKEGITQYSQIAAWKKADIIDFDEKLSFKGRIERDDWIAQAKILAKGGTTDFSKRATKGDVPSSS